ncbi:FkbM family methyltransferase [Panacibacter sp. DH6]|uniref:FkbM family methyltransferase n=1 Tax=Panacibacter microcysteis TaxID=2793269 RepID=A0A931E8J8_9BACT|nr:FkbM family methyltransferase [Panacibacter microcysteis]MBG9377134.1 FkbM family methyltransferase [Panacibacter microcysteis]
MSNKRPFDLRVADFLLRRLKLYKDKRNNAIAIAKWNHLFAGKDYFLHQPAGGPAMRLYKDSILSKYIYNGFEQAELTFVQKVLKPGDTFFDIGSNMGFFALYAAQITGANGKVYAFEPTPVIYKRLTENISENNFSNVQAENIGLSDAKGFLKLFIAEAGKDGWNSFAKEKEGQQSIEVPVNTLDHYVESNNVDTAKIRFIKIDVEGWEIPVVRGALKTINAHDDIILMMEFTESNSKAAGYNIGDLYDIIEQQGFKWYVFDEAQNKLLHDPKRNSYPYNNLFAVKNIDKVNAALTHS